MSKRPVKRPKVGDHTGLCSRCGSRRLWEDNLSYGCRDCGAVFIRT